MARSDLHQTRRLGYTVMNLDAVTTQLLGVINARDTVRHIAATTDEILTFLDEAGLHVDERMHRYSAEDEALAIADRLVADGKRLFWPYPLSAGRFEDTAHLVPPDLWLALNSKENLGAIAPQGAMPGRRVLDLEACKWPAGAGSVFLKSADGMATGWGYAVRHVSSANEMEAAKSDFRAMEITRVVAENAIEVTACWCANLGVVDAGVTFLGAAEQVFSAPGKQAASRIDPARPLPSAGVSLAIALAEAGRARGFRGICGFDIGVTRDGSVYVFDPNFRINSSTPQVMFHDSAAARSGFPVSLSFMGQSPHTMSQTIARLSSPVADGWFFPFRLLDHAWLESLEGASMITGFVLGETEATVQARSDDLAALLA
ncbi:MAG: hypothetical protein HRU32_02700, partial [Rhodobacteraceae bacterium]|nr:hypothetical protein [Paracoccaceae bacterium]